MAQLPDLDFKDYVDSMPSVTAFRSGDVMNLNGPNGPAKMAKDNLLKENAQNALAGNVAPSFDHSRTAENPYKKGELVVYSGELYLFDSEHYGLWTGDDVTKIDVQKLVKPLNSYSYKGSSSCVRRRTYQRFVTGFLAADGSVASSSNRAVTEYVDVSGISAFSVVSGVAAVSSEGYVFGCYYDTDKNFVGSISSSGTIAGQVNIIPPSAKYLRLTVSTTAVDAVVDESFTHLAALTASDCVDAFAVENVFGVGVADVCLKPDGTTDSSSTRAVTDYINVAGVSKIETLSGVASIYTQSCTFACFYDSSKVFIDYRRTDTNSNDVMTLVDIPSAAKYVRFTLNSKNNPCVVKIYGAESFKAMHANIDSVVSANEGFCPTSVYHATEDAYLNADGTLTESNARGVTDYIDVVGIDKIKTLWGIASIYVAQSTFACFYDSDKVFISAAKRATGEENFITEISVPDNAKYVRFTAVHKGWQGMAFISLHKVECLSENVAKNVKVGAKNYGKKFSLFGASWTYYFHTVYNKVDDWIHALNIQKFNYYGNGGATFSNLQASNNMQNQVDSVAEADWSNDVFVLWGSANDYTLHYPVGAADDYTSDDNYDESKLGTQCGGMNYCIKKILDNNPNATIIILSSCPIFGSKNGWVKKHIEGEDTLYDYVQGQKAVAARWSIPFLNQFESCGLNELNYFGLYRENDTTHLNADGYNKIVPQQIEFIASAC